jgi:hypothetical protein
MCVNQSQQNHCDDSDKAQCPSPLFWAGNGTHKVLDHAKKNVDSDLNQGFIEKVDKG